MSAAARCTLHPVALRAGIALALACLGVTPATAQYPTKPIRLIVPFAPGGGTDIVTRHIAARMSEGLGQQVVVDNRGGGGGSIGAELAARAAPDGYTIIMISLSNAANVSLYKLSYDPVTGVSPITLVGLSPFLVAVNPKVPIKSVRELVEHARANPGRLNYGSTGTGGITHLATELFRLMAEVQLTHVPYKGTGALLPDLIGGQIQLVFGSIVSTLPHHRAGRLRGFAVTGAKRSAAIPDLPTVGETVKGYDVTLWYALQGPANIPRPIVERLNAEAKRAVNLAEMRERLAAEGLEPTHTTPEQMRAVLKQEIARWTDVVKRASVKAE